MGKPGCLVVIFIFISPVVFIISISTINSIKSSIYYRDIKNVFENNNIPVKNIVKDYGNIYGNGNKCRTVVFTKIAVSGSLDSTLKLLNKINLSEVYRLSMNKPSPSIYMKILDEYHEVTSGFEENLGPKPKYLNEIVNLGIDIYKDDWKNGEIVIELSDFDDSELATWDPRCQ